MEHALYGCPAGGGYRFLAKSEGFPDEWLPLAERLCMGFGERPGGAACPGCVFVQPFGKRNIAVVQAADQGTDDAGRPGALAFYLLVMPRSEYAAAWDGDPFALAERFQPPWQARGELPELTYPSEAPPPRTVEQVRQVLQRHDGPTLLGAAQALVDGGRVVFPRELPDTPLLRDLWTLLPTSTRAQLWPASFTFANEPGYHVAVAPRLTEEFADYVTEEQAGDYPEGRYERGVQIAAETNDQRELDALFGRPSRQQVLRLGIALFIVMLAIVGLVKWMGPAEETPQESGKVATVPGLPAPELCRTDDERVRAKAIEQLRQLARSLGMDVGSDAKAKDLVEQIDHNLGTPDANRSPGPLEQYGPEVQRELRVLLWKHGVEGHDDVKLNTSELVERLQAKVAPREKQ
jgi:hypothetical protein